MSRAGEMTPAACRAGLKPQTGAEVLVGFMRRHGIRTVFAYPGTSELALCGAVLATKGMKLVNSRGDREAVFMAGGGNRLHGGTCCAIVHGARGLTNALGAIADLRRSEVPLLCVVGMASTASAAFLPPHAERDLIPDAGRFARAYQDCSSLADLDLATFADKISAAFAALEARPGGPVLLGVPQDLLSASFTLDDSAPGPPGPLPEPPMPDLAAAHAALSSARRPVILVDDYLFASGAGAKEALGNLATRIGAPVFQVAYRRGAMLFPQLRPEKLPSFQGAYQPAAREHRAVVHRADLLVTIEDRNMYPRVVGALGSAAKLAITGNRAAVLKNGYLGRDDLLVEGDVVKVMAALAARQAPRRCWLDVPVGPVRETTSGSGRQLVGALGAGLADGHAQALVDDSQMLGGLVAKNYDLLPAELPVYGSHGGFVGSGLATATGMAVTGSGRPVACLLGDQGLNNAVQVLSVIGERQAPLLVMVCNNGGSVSLRKQSLADGTGEAASSFLANSDRIRYTAVARSFGVTACSVTWPGVSASTAQVARARRQLAERIRDALMRRAPVMIELVVPGTPEFWAGVWNVSGMDLVAAAGERHAGSDTECGG